MKSLKCNLQSLTPKTTRPSVIIAGLVISLTLILSILSIQVIAKQLGTLQPLTPSKTLTMKKMGVAAFSKQPPDDNIPRYYLTPGPSLSRSTRFFPTQAKPYFADRLIPNRPTPHAPRNQPSPSVTGKLSASSGFSTRLKR